MIPGTPAPRVQKGLKVQRVRRESLAPRATPETLERKAQKATQVTPAPRAQKGLKVRQAPRESLALRAILATPVPRGSKATKENPEPHILRV